MVMIARFRSSRKSLSVIRFPALKLAISIVFSETSKQMGMLKRLPSAMRTFSTTLLILLVKDLRSPEFHGNLRIVVLFIEET